MRRFRCEKMAQESTGRSAGQPSLEASAETNPLLLNFWTFKEVKMKRTLIMALVVFCFSAQSLMAQRVEIQPFFGYQFSNSLETEPFVYQGDTYNKFTFDNGLAYGMTFGMFVQPQMEVEFAWSNQPSTFRAGGTASGYLDRADMNIHNFHGNFLYHFGDPEAVVRPYVLGGIGATYFSPKSDWEGKTKFSTNWGGGVKFMPSRSLGLRLQALWTPTYLGSQGEEWIYDPYWGTWWAIADTTYLHQFQMTAGVSINF